MKNYFRQIWLIFFLALPFISNSRINSNMKLIDDLCWCGVEYYDCDDYPNEECDPSMETKCDNLCHN